MWTGISKTLSNYSMNLKTAHFLKTNWTLQFKSRGYMYSLFNYVEILRKKTTTLNRINIVILFQFSDIRKYILWYKNKISLNFWYQRIDFFFTSKQLKIFSSKNSNSWYMYLKIIFWNQKIHLICNSFICNLKGFHTNNIHIQINTAAIHNQLVLRNKLKLNKLA